MVKLSTNSILNEEAELPPIMKLPLDELTWYETTSQLIIVGTSTLRHEYRMLKIAKSNENLKLFFDLSVHTRESVDSFLAGLRENHRSFPSGRARAIIGFVRFLKGYYIILVKSRRKVTQIGLHAIYEVTDTTIISLNETSDSVFSSPIKSDEDKYLNMFKSFDIKKYFYYSHSYDLTNTLQTNMTRKYKTQQTRKLIMHNYRNQKCEEEILGSFAVNSCSLSMNNSESTPPPLQPPPLQLPPVFPSYVAAPRSKFIWNEHLLRPTKELSLFGEDEGVRSLSHRRPSDWLSWAVALIHGCVTEANIESAKGNLRLIIIGRSSKNYAGARYLKRGVNSDGHVANYVEVEQILIDINSLTRYDARGNFSSFTQVRGSVPVVWYHPHVNLPKPPIVIGQNDPQYTYTRKHFEELLEDFGSPIVAINLLKSVEAKSREMHLSQEYFSALHTLSLVLKSSRTSLLKVNEMIEELHTCALTPHVYLTATLQHSLTSTASSTLVMNCLSIHTTTSSAPQAFVHDEDVLPSKLFQYVEFDLRNSGQSAWNSMTAIAEARIPQLGIFTCKRDGSVTALQCGTLRSNCVDCIDRTNLGQFFFGLHALGLQLQSIGVLHDSVDISRSPDLSSLLLNAYLQLGDAIAIQYGGSAQVGAGLLHRGLGWDQIMGIRRLYTNMIVDRDKQMVTNLFLGLYTPMDNEFDETFHRHNRISIPPYVHLERNFLGQVLRAFPDPNRHIDLTELEQDYYLHIKTLPEVYRDTDPNWFRLPLLRFHQRRCPVINTEFAAETIANVNATLINIDQKVDNIEELFKQDYFDEEEAEAIAKTTWFKSQLRYIGEGSSVASDTESEFDLSPHGGVPGNNVLSTRITTTGYVTTFAPRVVVQRPFVDQLPIIRLAEPRNFLRVPRNFIIQEPQLFNCAKYPDEIENSHYIREQYKYRSLPFWKGPTPPDFLHLVYSGIVFTDRAEDKKRNDRNTKTSKVSTEDDSVRSAVCSPFGIPSTRIAESPLLLTSPINRSSNNSSNTNHHPIGRALAQPLGAWMHSDINVENMKLLATSIQHMGSPYSWSNENTLTAFITMDSDLPSEFIKLVEVTEYTGELFLHAHRDMIIKDFGIRFFQLVENAKKIFNQVHNTLTHLNFFENFLSMGNSTVFDVKRMMAEDKLKTIEYEEMFVAKPGLEGYEYRTTEHRRRGRIAQPTDHMFFEDAISVIPPFWEYNDINSEFLQNVLPNTFPLLHSTIKAFQQYISATLCEYNIELVLVTLVKQIGDRTTGIPLCHALRYSDEDGREIPVPVILPNVFTVPVAVSWLEINSERLGLKIHRIVDRDSRHRKCRSFLELLLVASIIIKCEVHLPEATGLSITIASAHDFDDDGNLFTITSVLERNPLNLLSQGVKAPSPQRHIKRLMPPLELAEAMASIALSLFNQFDEQLRQGITKGTNLSMSLLSQNTFDMTEGLLNADISSLGIEERICFFINVYNALYIQAWIMACSRPQTNLLVFYQTRGYIISGHFYSLADIKHGILRGNRASSFMLFPQFLLEDARKVLSVKFNKRVTSRIMFALVDTYVAHDRSSEIRSYDPIRAGTGDEGGGYNGATNTPNRHSRTKQSKNDTKTFEETDQQVSDDSDEEVTKPLAKNTRSVLQWLRGQRKAAAAANYCRTMHYETLYKDLEEMELQFVCALFNPSASSPAAPLQLASREEESEDMLASWNYISPVNSNDNEDNPNVLSMPFRMNGHVYPRGLLPLAGLEEFGHMDEAYQHVQSIYKRNQRRLQQIQQCQSSGPTDVIVSNKGVC